MRPVVAALAVLFAACGGAATTASEVAPQARSPQGDLETRTAEVVSVTDGDTIDVRIDGREEPVRLIGIDAPERGDCFAAEATAALRRLVAGRTVELLSDTSERDRYERLLRYVLADGTHVNAVLVRGGFAVAKRYPPDTARADELADAEREARDEAAGLWGQEGCRP